MNRRVAAAAAAGFLILLVAVLGSAPGENDAAPVIAAAPGMPSYCGTKATERLPECGWTEAKEKTPTRQPYDSCSGASEAEVRKMWVVVKGTQPSGTDATRMTADLLRQAEELCREFRDAKPTPLPPELKELVR